MTRSAIRTLLSKFTGAGGRSRDGSYTDDTSAKTHTSSSFETLDHSLQATSGYHESFAGYNIPPCPGIDRIDEAALAYELQLDALYEDGVKRRVKRVMPLADTFRPEGLIRTLHPGCFDSVADNEEWWNSLWDGLPEITGSSTVCWNEIPTWRPGDGPCTPYTATLGSLSVMDDTGSVRFVAGFDFKDGCPADAWNRLQESINSRAEIKRTASEAPKSRSWCGRRKR